MFLAGGAGLGERVEMAYSTNGSSWTTVSNNQFGDAALSFIPNVAYGNNRFISVGDRGSMAYSEDGENWTDVMSSKLWEYKNGRNTITADIKAIAYGSAGNAGSRFVAVGQGGRIAYADW